jgi:hypothetical protein
MTQFLTPARHDVSYISYTIPSKNCTIGDTDADKSHRYFLTRVLSPSWMGERKALHPSTFNRRIIASTLEHVSHKPEAGSQKS